MTKVEFSSPVDLPEELSKRAVDSLDVHESRLLVIYDSAILDVEILSGTIGAAETVAFEIQEGHEDSAVSDEDIAKKFESLLVSLDP